MFHVTAKNVRISNEELLIKRLTLEIDEMRNSRSIGSSSIRVFSRVEATWCSGDVRGHCGRELYDVLCRSCDGD